MNAMFRVKYEAVVQATSLKDALMEVNSQIVSRVEATGVVFDQSGTGWSATVVDGTASAERNDHQDSAVNPTGLGIALIDVHGNVVEVLQTALASSAA